MEYLPTKENPTVQPAEELARLIADGLFTLMSITRTHHLSIRALVDTVAKYEGKGYEGKWAAHMEVHMLNAQRITERFMQLYPELRQY